MPRAHTSFVFTLVIVALSHIAAAQETERQYLSGYGKDDAIPWQFRCSAGRRANEWTTIRVPSNWELQGFGIFSYGVDRQPKTPVRGDYRTSFTTPAEWSGRRVFLVFEGAMTDTEARINGQVVGPIHQGGYYRFKYEVTKLLRFGQENQLDVAVVDESADRTVNGAERRGDYWNYGGIYRPVYFEAVPAEFIEHVTIDARSDGTIAVSTFVDGLATADNIDAQVLDLDGHPVGQSFVQPISSKAEALLKWRVDSPRLWTAETPNLYQLDILLKKGNTVLHALRQRFGFRTIEVRPADGIYVNGRKVVLKGSDRHSFWPDSGRCTSEQVSRDDVALMKDMNANAVRMSHYPPDQHFLDACDELGLYVLDELGGWHHAYGDVVGHKLTEEMVARDVNHPSILFWDNGNEGGWNTALDGDYARLDPQARHVLHPWAKFGDIDTHHYAGYAEFQKLCAAGDMIVMPTEFLHGLYDGGAGAGLEDYWNVVRQNKTAAGGFIWAFVDEAVKRVDKDGQLDTHGSAAPDGIVGPYREKEGSYYTIKQIWSPITIDRPELGDAFDGRLTVHNSYSFTDAKQCVFHWELRTFRRPEDGKSGFTPIAMGDARPTQSIAPGSSGEVKLDLPATWRRADALAVRVSDPGGRELWTWVWPIPSSAGSEPTALSPVPRAPGVGETAGAPQPVIEETADRLKVRAGELSVAFDKQTGMLLFVTRGERMYPLANGPHFVSRAAVQPTLTTTTTSSTTKPAVAAAEPATQPLVDTKLLRLDHHMEGSDQIVEAGFEGNLKSVRWRIRPDGWLMLDYVLTLRGPQEFFGVGFDLPEADVKSMRWLGNGPFRVWKNRLAGGTLGVWQNDYNDTITGDRGWKYPEFKGYYSDVRWAQLETTAGPVTAVIDADRTPFLQVLTPSYPPGRDARYVSPPFPSAGLSFLHAIPAIGTKFHPAWVSGPQSQPAVAAGEYSGSVGLYFGDLPG